MKNGQKAAFPAITIEQTKNSYGDVTGYQSKIFSNGLTKREYFAAMAMQGLCVNGAWETSIQKQAESVGGDSSQAIAVYAVDLADNLLKALES